LPNRDVECLVVQLVNIHDQLAGKRPLDLVTALAAIEIADWFAAQQLEILAAGRLAAKERKRMIILDLLVDHPKGITSRAVHRANHWSAGETDALLDEMVNQGKIVSSETPTGGHPLRVYRLRRVG
jgi:hypothetical protein